MVLDNLTYSEIIDSSIFIHLSLSSAFSIYNDIIDDIINTKNDKPLFKSLSLKSLEKFRSANYLDKRNFVDKATAGNRLRTIRDYVVWLANGYLGRAKINSLNFFLSQK